jgi:hypothetical protein
MMKKFFFCAALIALASIVLSCEQKPSEAARVWGYVAPNILPSKFEASGSLGGENDRYYGYCRFKNDIFSFGLGSHKPANNAPATAFYMSVFGISGPPAEGVFKDGVPKTSSNLRKRFQSAKFHVGATQSWTVEGADLPDDFDLCHVDLFAQALGTERLPQEYGSGSFDYYLGISCTSLEVPDNAGQSNDLTSFYVSLYFSGCDD